MTCKGTKRRVLLPDKVWIGVVGDHPASLNSIEHRQHFPAQPRRIEQNLHAILLRRAGRHAAYCSALEQLRVGAGSDQNEVFGSQPVEKQPVRIDMAVPVP